MKYPIDDMRRSDWARVRTLYGEGLATGMAAFMTNPPVWKDWDTGHLAFGRLVARNGGGSEDVAILGWAALAPVPDT